MKKILLILMIGFVATVTSAQLVFGGGSVLGGGVFGGGAGDVSPLPAGVARWYDASDASTITMSVASNITAWADKSDNGDDAIQVGADTTRPTYCSNQLNGLCTIRFDGGDYLGTTYHSLDGQTVFFVATSDTGGRYSIGARDSSNQRSYIHNTGAVNINVGATSGINIGVWFGYQLIGFDYDGATVHGYLGGILAYNAAQSGTGANPTQGYYIGTFNDAGSPFGSMMIGNVAEVIIYERVVSEADRQQVEAYLTDKWGL